MAILEFLDTRMRCREHGSTFGHTAEVTLNTAKRQVDFFVAARPTSGRADAGKSSGRFLLYRRFGPAGLLRESDSGAVDRSGSGRLVVSLGVKFQ
jgi:hypothetical protein